MAWLHSALEWAKNLPPSVALTAITLLPALELRASIPYGIAREYPLPFVVTVCVIANIVLGLMVFFFLDKFVHLFLRWKRFERIYTFYVERAQRKIQKPVERWGELGVAVFIGIPLPGSGVYTGALAAYVLGLSYRKFMIANVIGVLIAATAVTIVCLFFKNTVFASWFYKAI